MKVWNKDDIIKRINEVLPEGKVIPRHNEKGHFYEVDGVIHPSVTGKLQVLKDEGLINYKMNRAIESLRNFIFARTTIPTMEEIEEACTLAGRVSQDILEDAGDIGHRVHEYREKIFKQWIETGVRPADFTSFIPPEDVDIRSVSALRGLQKFCEERDYIPVAVEKLVYSHKLKVAGTLDDLGLIREVLHEPEIAECDHSALFGSHAGVQDEKGRYTCLQCGYQYRYEFVLMDLKTSNQFKNHYFFQVALYWWMFWQLLGIEWKPKKCIIVKVSKEDGSYKIEDLKMPARLASYARAMIKTNEGVEFIKLLRKDNQKAVAPIMQL